MPKVENMNCPYCQQLSKWKDNPFRPFCSERCKLIDLGQWVGEQYRIPGRSLVIDVSELNPEEDSLGETPDHP